MSGKLKGVLVVFLLLLLVCVPLLGACGGEAEKEAAPIEEEVLKFGISMDFTSYYASAQRIAVEGMLDHWWYINEKGGIDGVKIEVLWADDAATASKGLSIWNDFVGKGVTQYVAGATEVLEIIKDRADKMGMSIITGSAATPSLFPQKTIFAPETPYPSACAAFVEWYAEEVWDKWDERPPKFAFVTSDTAGGRGIITDELKAFIEKKGIPIVATVLPPAAPIDMTPYVETLKKAEADFGWGMMVPTNCIPFLRDLKRMGLTGKFIWGGPSTADLEQGLKADPVAMEGAVMIGSPATIDQDVRAIREIKEAHQMKYGGLKEDLVVRDNMYRWGWSWGYLWEEAYRGAIKWARETGTPISQITPRNVLEHGVYTIKDFDPAGIFPGKVTFKPLKTWGADAVSVQQVKGGKIVSVGSARVYPEVFPKADMDAYYKLYPDERP